jgi:hydrogenase maturation protein HypF
LCWESGIACPKALEPHDGLLRAAFEAGLNAPLTTAVGRLFDAVAALLGVRLNTSYEAEAPMCLEALCDADGVCGGAADAAIPLPLAQDAAGIWRSDWAPLVRALLDADSAPPQRAALFHASLARALCDQARAVRAHTGVARVGLAGGVFQNRILTESAHARLRAAGFEVLIPQRLPVNDAAISFGQLIEVAALQGEH